MANHNIVSNEPAAQHAPFLKYIIIAFTILEQTVL